MLFESLPPDVQGLALHARAIAQKRLAPIVAECERAGGFSAEIREILAEAGFFGLVVPAAYGGTDTDLRFEAVVIQEVAKVYPSAATYLTADWVPAKLLVAAARAGQDDGWLLDALGRSAATEWIGAIAATEPEAGSDLGAIRTRAGRDGDQWVVSGSKRFITNGGFADYYVVAARTGGPGPGGVSLLFVEADRPGVAATRWEDKMGMHGSATAEMVFDDVRIPADHVVGPVDGGFGLLMGGFDEGRVLVAALSLGIAEAALDHAVAYARNRRQFGREIASFQGLQFLIADMATSVYAARSLTYDAAQAYVDGRADATRMASMAKTFASDAAMQVTTDAVQVHGGYGYTRDFPVEMLMRDTKVNQIYEGTNQIQRMIIARSYFAQDRSGG